LVGGVSWGWVVGGWFSFLWDLKDKRRKGGGGVEGKSYIPLRATTLDEYC
jgi:hypothetical protein